MPSEPSLRVGCIGLGKMGAGICANVRRAGYSLGVYDAVPWKMRALADIGARACESPKQVAEGSDIVITSVLDDASVHACIEGDAGMLAGFAQGSVHVCATTISPSASTEFDAIHRQAGSYFVAAPVAGRPDAAEAGKLLSFVAGAPDAVERARDVIECYSERVTILGAETALANAMKIVTNYMGMVELAMIGEVFAFAERSGLNSEYVETVLHMMFAAEPIRDSARRIKERDFEDSGMDLACGYKDALIFEKAFDDLHLSPAAMLSAKQQMRLALTQGLGELDWAAMYEGVRLASGLEIRKKA